MTWVMRCICALLLAAAALAADPAVAQKALPSDRVTEAQREEFRLCRAAIYMHLQQPPDPASAVPRPVAQALLAQMTFVMSETMRSAPGGSLAQASETLAFVESFFIDFAGALARHRSRLSDVAERDRALIGCVPLIWGAMSEDIDYLMLWRERAINPPAFQGGSLGPP